MKERPILFNGPMVRAIIANRKKKTRRVMKNQPNIDPQTGDWLFTFSDGRQEVHPIKEWVDVQIKLHCPYGKVGDRLWVRETWAKMPGDADPGWSARYVCYRADNSCYIVHYGGESNRAVHLKHFDKTPDKWRPSIHMPRNASRILLEITDIQAEPLTYIDESDAVLEGIESFRPVPGDGPAETLYLNYETGMWTTSARYSFDTLWESVYGPKSFEANPWVWVISFKVI
jgi:hypothetical protein